MVLTEETTLYAPGGFLAVVEKEAKKDRRSRNAEIIALVEEALAARMVKK